MKEILLTIGFGLLLLWLVWRWRWLAIPGLTKPVLLSLFGLKALAALLYGFYHSQFVGGGDTFLLTMVGDQVYQYLRTDPLTYLRLVFGPNGGEPPPGMAQAVHDSGYWNYTPTYMMVRINALLRIISFGVYEVHALCYAFLVFMAQVALLKHLSFRFPGHLAPLALAIFCTPTVLFYGSGMHKEGLVIIGLCMVVIHLAQSLDKRWRTWSVLWLLCGLFLLYLVKDLYLAALLPCLAGWVWVHYFPGRAVLKMAISFALVWAAMFHLHYLMPEMDAAARIAAKQAEFRSYRGATNIHIPQAEPTLAGILKILPAGFVNALLKPWPWAWHNTWAVFYGMENMVVLALALLAVFSRKLKVPRGSIPAVLLLFSLSAMTLIGAIVPNLGAISRYRSPALLALVVALVLLIPAETWQRLFSRLKLMRG